MKRVVTVLMLILVGVAIQAGTAGAGSGDQLNFQSVMVPMNDGAHLETHVFTPSTPGPYPVVLCRTPYSVGRRSWLGEGLAARGFAVVLQSVRGQGESQGRFMPFVNEKADGVATVDWIVDQPWCDGRIGLWGVSYHGYAAFELASTGHPAVRAVFHISGWSDLSKFMSHGGAFQLQAHLYWYYAFASGQPAPPLEAWPDIFRTIPLGDFFRGAEPVWDHAAKPYDFNDIKVPIMHVTGWYDYIYPNVLQTWAAMRETERAPEQRLIIGPWSHNGVLNSWTKVGDVEFGEAAAAGMDWAMDRAAQWYRHALDGEANELSESSPVSYFVMNDNRWAEDETWPPANAEFQSWYLHEGGLLSRDAPSGDGETGFVFDPHDPVPTVGGANSHFFPDNLGPKDQTVIGERGDVLRFTSEPLTRDIVIAGPITAEVYASTTGRDTDFTAKLSVVQADGFVRNVEDGIVRARHLFPGDEEGGFVEPGRVYRYDIECGATALAVAAGSRLQVEISSSNFPKYDRNPNTGADPIYATEFVPATQTVQLSKTHPTRAVVPVLR